MYLYNNLTTPTHQHFGFPPMDALAKNTIIQKSLPQTIKHFLNNDSKHLNLDVSNPHTENNHV